MICGYVALRFDPKFAVPVLIAIFHDILITAGVYSLTGKEVSSGTVAAFLTILGYSIYDTIIVFDRIRENVPRMPRAAFTQIVNRSMSEVLTRSLATSFTTLLGVMSLLIFGGATLQDFAFAMLVGIASGTYSSIFIASPVLAAWKEREPVSCGAACASPRSRAACRPSPTTWPPPSSAATKRAKPRSSPRSNRPRRSSRRGGRHGRADEDGNGADPAVNGESGDGRGEHCLGGAASAQCRTAGTSAATPQTREEALGMALLVWFTMGIALWHFTVFLPDHFWQGIVGAFVGAVLGAVIFGLIVALISGKSFGDTDLGTALLAIPGVAIGLAIVYAIGVRGEEQLD